MMKSKLFATDDKVLLQKPNQTLHYYYGEFEDYQDARAIKVDILSKQLSEMAEIVPFINMKAISNDMIPQWIDTYPDLGNLSTYGN